MKHFDTIKKSELKKVPSGFERKMCCERVFSVLNENDEILKFNYNMIDETLTILSDNFKLLTIEYK